MKGNQMYMPKKNHEKHCPFNCKIAAIILWVVPYARNYSQKLGINKRNYFEPVIMHMDMQK